MMFSVLFLIEARDQVLNLNETFGEVNLKNAFEIITFKQRFF